MTRSPTDRRGFFYGLRQAPAGYLIVCFVLFSALVHIVDHAVLAWCGFDRRGAGDFWFVIAALVGALVWMTWLQSGRRKTPDELTFFKQQFVALRILTILAFLSAAMSMCLAYAVWQMARALVTPPPGKSWVGWVLEDHGFRRIPIAIVTYAVRSALWFAVALALFWLSRRARRQLHQAEGRCVKCGYLLRGLTEPRCPECGTAFDPGQLARAK